MTAHHHRSSLARLILAGLLSLGVAAPAQLAQAEEPPPPPLRIAKAELISGASLVALGLAGLGIMGSGIYLRREADRELAQAGLSSVEELPEGAARDSFAAQIDRGTTMTAAGAVIAAAGSALGIALVIAGARDLKRARASEIAGLRGLRVAPAIGGRSLGLTAQLRF